ncbi:DUF4912 domain-containing protein [Domibacillus robiginosus]|uniref:DUF4912 domain-containing protein n=1 Tax=Domibacillus robiginosus TaxID=1071054 RepID=UPI00067A86C5|nr:DUF4912 domain-containing protein [Domibacillus robiginosus]
MIEEITRLKSKKNSWEPINDTLSISEQPAKQTWPLESPGKLKRNVQNSLHTVLLSKDRLYCRWSIHPFLLRAAFYCEAPLNPNVLDLRIFDVTDIYFNGVNAHSMTCVKVNKEDSFWTIKGLKKNRSYLCEIGYLTKDYLFWPILQSHPVHTSYERSTDYILKRGEAEAFYHYSFKEPAWIEHPDCFQ